MNPTTFGNHKSSMKLVEILEEIENRHERAKISRKVSNAFHNFNIGIWELHRIKDLNFKEKMLWLWFEDRKWALHESYLPKLVERHLLCVLMTVLREHINVYINFYKKRKGSRK